MASEAKTASIGSIVLGNRFIQTLPLCAPSAFAHPHESATHKAPMSMTHRALTLALTLFLAACTGTTEIEEVTSERWVGDVGTTNMMMLMTIAHRGTSVSGSGGFTAVLVPGSTQSYTITGMRRADTLDLLLKRTGEQVHFVGRYSDTTSRQGLSGTLAGGDYYGTTVVLRRQ